MARYRRRYRTIIRAPRKKWGSNMIGVELQVQNETSNVSAGFHLITLAANKTETTAPTPVIVKTGNFRLQGDMSVSNGSSLSTAVTATLYIVYIPQGMEPTTYAAASALVVNHPEWIMAWRVLETGVNTQSSTLDSNRFTMTSRLKRNLNSGDGVFALLMVTSLAPTSTAQVKGMCQFWTCAN